MLFNNVEDIVNRSLCMGCGVCEPVCPVRCIDIAESPINGQLLPIVDQDVCVSGCDVCLRVCPGEEVDFNQLNQEFLGKTPERTDVGIVDRAFVGHATDEELRFASSSGGVTTALLVYLLDTGMIDGAIVLRMNPEQPHESEVVVARTREEIIECKGSKYCPAKSGVGLRAVMRNPERFAFVGLPCHIHGVRKFQQVFKKYRDRIVLTIGIFCGAGITMHGTRFLLGQLGIPEDNLEDLQLRGKGWPGKTTAKSKDGRTAELNKRAGARNVHEAAVYTSWMHRYFAPPRCLTCTDMTAQLADISIGDPWLPRFMQKESSGLSLVAARSNLGKRALELAVRDGAVKIVDEVSVQEIADSQGKLQKKLNTRPYRIAARILGIGTPEYGQLYGEGPTRPLAVIFAIWEYLRIRLANYRFLWPLLLKLEILTQHRQRLTWKWRGRLRRLSTRVNLCLREIYFLSNKAKCYTPKTPLNSELDIRKNSDLNPTGASKVTGTEGKEFE